MREKGLHRSLLESKKTTSKKQLEKLSAQVSSRGSSRATSNTNSRSVSRQVSEDEDDDSDDTGMSASSFGELRISDPEDDDLPDTSNHDFKLLIEEILERKGSTVHGRELALSRYVKYLSRHVCEDEVSGAKGEALIGSFMKSIKNEDSEKEVCLAMKAIKSTFVTNPPDMKDEDFATIKRLVSDENSSAVRAEAISTLSCVAVLSDDEQGQITLMEEYITMLTDEDITDKKNDLPFEAACQEWAFLASWADFDDQGDTIEPATAFKRQLENKDTDVQIAAGKALALLYERFSDEDGSEDEGSDVDDSYQEKAPKPIDLFAAYDETADLLNRVRELSGDSKAAHRGKGTKDLHKTFRSVLVTMERPTRGPGWRGSIDPETGRARGYSMKVSIRNRGVCYINKWYILLRYEALVRILEGGLIEHYEHNPRIVDILPIILEAKGAKSSRR